MTKHSFDEEVARLHLEGIGVKLTKKQADYLGVPVEGPYNRNITSTEKFAPFSRTQLRK